MVTGSVCLPEYEGVYLFGADGAWYSQAGWAQLPTGERCYVNQDGKLALGLNKIDGKYYRFAIDDDRTEEVWYSGWGRWDEAYPAGALMTGKYEAWGEYLADEYGVVQVGWKTIGGDTYYFGESVAEADSAKLAYGKSATGWMVINGKVYYFSDSGAMLTGKQEVRDREQPDDPYRNGVYLFGDDGVLYENPGWLQMSNGDWYYVNSDSTLATGWKDIGGESYYFGENGVMRTGFYWANGQQYWSDPNGVWHETAWRQDSNGWWFDFGNGTYAQNSWQPIGDEWYHFDSNGYMQVGWLYLGGTWYYLAGSGAMQVGWLHNGGVWYFLNSSGDMATGWKKIGNTWYYLNGGGDMAENRWIGNYWIGADGAMATSAWVDGGKYYVGSDGAYDPQARRQEAAA